MSLSDEQRAILQLLLEGGEGYEDLAGLLGVPTEQVRSRAASALGDLAAADSATSNELTDYLLGQAEPRAAAATEADLASDPDELARVRRLHARLRLLYPAARLPAIPAAATQVLPAIETDPVRIEPTPEPEPAPPAKTEATAPPEMVPVAPSETSPATPSGPEPAPPADPALSPQQKKLLALLVGSGLVIVIAVLAVTGAFGGSDTPAGDGADTTAAARTGASADETVLTRAVLQPQDGSDGAGVAIFGAIDEETPVLQVTARNLAPTREGEEYSVWLYQTDEIALRLAGLEVGRNGRIATQIQLPGEALNFIVDGTLNQVDISRNRKRAYRQELNASQTESRLPRRIGTSILRGQITGPGLGTTTGNQ